MPPRDSSFTIPPDLEGRPLDFAIRTLAELTWGEARRLIQTSKVRVEGHTAATATRHVHAGDRVEIVMHAPRDPAATSLPRDAIVYSDTQVVVVHKPPGVSTVPYDENERGTLDQLVARMLHRGRPGPAPSLGVVQRLDKETSGLVVFARTFAAKKVLGSQLRLHTMHRRYYAIASGDVIGRTFRTQIVADRGDGVRGSSRHGREGQLAVTHVEPVERLRGATLIACQLETGRTHQIRIHLSEAGHPLVGERVYVRGLLGPRLEAPRIMLHASELGFEHPVTREQVRFEAPLPDDFRGVLASLRIAPPRR